MTSRFSLTVFAASTIALTACAGAPQIDGGQYWQRVSTSEAVYQQGPKAQQMLNRDIGRCVIELRELERLGTIKNAIPTDFTGRVLNPDEHKLGMWDSPEHDGTLLAEHTDYHDFDGCMLSKGWERTKHVPYKVAENARVNYYLAHVDYGYDPKLRLPADSSNAGSFDRLND